MLDEQVHATEAPLVLVGIGEHIGGMQALISYCSPLGPRALLLALMWRLVLPRVERYEAPSGRRFWTRAA